MSDYRTVFPLSGFADTPTPFYYYDMDLLHKTLETIRREVPVDDPSYHVHYAIKANSNPVLLQTIASYGLGADCVSGGEIRAAIESGFPADRIVYAGVGKSDAEIALGLDTGISCFNVESLPELEVIDMIAASKNIVAQIALRVNPNIDAHTHHYITTGLEENKFGINLDNLPELVKRCSELQHVRLTGLHFHIGSQILTMEPYRLLCERINDLQATMDDYGIDLQSINVGGGLGINYDNPDTDPIPDFKSYFTVFRQYLKLRPGQQLHFELGRSIVAQCGSLISRVLYIKHGTSRKFAIVDAGMTELIRPALYGAHHQIQNLSTPDAPVEIYDVVGPVCESSDYFGRDEHLPQLQRGDFIALRSAGAYGEAMASRYNCRMLNPSTYSKISD